MDSNSIIFGIILLSTIFVSISLYLEAKNTKKEENNKAKLRQMKIDEILTQNNSTDEAEDKPETVNLDLLKDITRDQIQLLKLNDIISIIDLKSKIYTDENIKDISLKIGARKKLVEEWVNLGEFSRLKGINQIYIDQLTKMGINSIIELAKQDPLTLFDELRGQYPAEYPSIGMINYWIRNARNIDENLLYN